MEPLNHISAIGLSKNKQNFPAYFPINPHSALKQPHNAPTPVFLQNLNAQLHQHLSDEKLNVHRLTRLVGMSRTDLHRKLSRTVGMSTTEYIRYFRLQRAAQLLVAYPDWTIYHVAMEVGFENQSYFSRRFKEVYGVCPMEWRAGGGNLEHT